MKIIIDRIFSNENVTLSNGVIVNNKKDLFKFKGIELPWRNNERGISCIPPGIYDGIATTRWSNKKYALLINDVPDRSEIMVHTANYVHQLLGCLAPGKTFADIDRDGVIDVTSSQNTMDEIQKIIPIGTKFKYHVVESWRLYGNNENIEL